LLSYGVDESQDRSFSGVFDGVDLLHSVEFKRGLFEDGHEGGERLVVGVALLGEDGSGFHEFLHVGVELLGLEADADAHGGVGAVDDHAVLELRLVLGLLHPLDCVLLVLGHFGVLQRDHTRELLGAHVRHLLVDVHHSQVLKRSLVLLFHLVRYAAIAAAHDQNASLGRRLEHAQHFGLVGSADRLHQTCENRVCQSRAVDVSEAVAELDHPVEDEGSAEPGVLKDFQLLEWTLLRVQAGDAGEEGKESVRLFKVEHFGGHAAVQNEVGDHVLSPEQLAQSDCELGERLPGRVQTVLEVQSQLAGLGPCVDGEVTLFEQPHHCQALRLELFVQEPHH